jgi:hypothetical protein
VWGHDDAGDEAREPALSVEIKTGFVSCAVDQCFASWLSDALEGLAEQLRRQTMHEVLCVSSTHD